MKICPSCNHPNQDHAGFCTTCGTNIAAATIQPEPAPITSVAPAPITPPPVPVYEAKPKEPLSWADICGLVGFVSAIVGIFCCSVVLLPIGIVLSLLGFLGNRFKGLTVAGLIISLLGALIKICVVLHTSGLVPEWVTQGIFS